MGRFQGLLEGSLLRQNDRLIGTISYVGGTGNDVVIGIALSGDFDGNGPFTGADINALTAAIAAGGDDPAFDLNGDGVVDLTDQTVWLSQAGGFQLGPGQSYLPGDANLDTVVDVSDFNLWNAHKFTENTAWTAGNFNGDNSIDVADFLVWISECWRSG